MPPFLVPLYFRVLLWTGVTRYFYFCLCLSLLHIIFHPQLQKKERGGTYLPFYHLFH